MRFVLLLLAACHAAPDPKELFTAIQARDAARVGAILDATPSLASAHDDSMSAVLAALFTLNPDNETFVDPQHNDVLAAIVAHHPALDIYDAIACGDDARVAALVTEDPARASTIHPSLGMAPIHVAAFAGRVATLMLLLAKGVAVDTPTKNKFHSTPLLHAALTKQLAAARVLLDAGANVEASEEGGLRALHLAAESGDVEMIRLLVDHHATIDAKADDGKTPAALATTKGRTAAVQLLTASAAAR
jgi:ankyrin repeat protein